MLRRPPAGASAAVTVPRKWPASRPDPWETAAHRASVTARPELHQADGDRRQQDGEGNVHQDRPQQHADALAVEGLEDAEQQQGDDHHAGQRGHGGVVGPEPGGAQVDGRGGRARTPPIWPSSHDGPAGHPAADPVEHAADAESDGGTDGRADRRRRPLAAGTGHTSRARAGRRAPAAEAGTWGPPGVDGQSDRDADTQCTPCPVAKKKLTMAGPAPISRAANPDTRTAFRPL